MSAITELDYALNCAAVEIDTTNARAELAQLRAAAAELQRIKELVDPLEGQSVYDAVDYLMADDSSHEVYRIEAAELKRTVAEQAAQLEQARTAWNSLCNAIDALHFSGKVDGLGRVADAREMWPNIHAPAPEAEGMTK